MKEEDGKGMGAGETVVGLMGWTGRLMGMVASEMATYGKILG